MEKAQKKRVVKGIIWKKEYEMHNSYFNFIEILLHSVLLCAIQGASVVCSYYLHMFAATE